MNIATCKKCKRIFQQRNNEKLCPECTRELEEKFKEVKTFIRRHRGCGLQEVSNTCEVPVEQLIDWIRQDRLIFDKTSDVKIPCESCGTLISSGRYCNKCKAKLERDLKQVVLGDIDKSDSGDLVRYHTR